MQINKPGEFEPPAIKPTHQKPTFLVTRVQLDLCSCSPLCLVLSTIYHVRLIHVEEGGDMPFLS